MAQKNGKASIQPVGRGVEMVHDSDLNEGDTYTVLRFRNDGDFGRSKGGTGPNQIVASTGGNLALANGINLGVNAYRKP